MDPSSPSLDPGERRLDRPPSDRYADRATATNDLRDPLGETSNGRRDMARALGAGLVVGLLGAIAIVVLGGVFSVSAGLLIVALIIGWAIGRAMVGQSGLANGARPRTRALLASFLAVDAVILGQLGLWVYAGTEGGVLPLTDYLLQTFGPLVPLEIVLAAGAAWWAAR